MALENDHFSVNNQERTAIFGEQLENSIKPLSIGTIDLSKWHSLPNFKKDQAALTRETHAAEFELGTVEDLDEQEKGAHSELTKLVGVAGSRVKFLEKFRALETENTLLRVREQRFQHDPLLRRRRLDQLDSTTLQVLIIALQNELAAAEEVNRACNLATSPLFKPLLIDAPALDSEAFTDLDVLVGAGLVPNSSSRLNDSKDNDSTVYEVESEGLKEKLANPNSLHKSNHCLDYNESQVLRLENKMLKQQVLTLNSTLRTLDKKMLQLQEILAQNIKNIDGSGSEEVLKSVNSFSLNNLGKPMEVKPEVENVAISVKSQEAETRPSDVNVVMDKEAAKTVSNIKGSSKDKRRKRPNKGNAPLKLESKVLEDDLAANMKAEQPEDSPQQLLEEEQSNEGSDRDHSPEEISVDSKDQPYFEPESTPEKPLDPEVAQFVMGALMEGIEMAVFQNNQDLIYGKVEQSQRQKLVGLHAALSKAQSTLLSQTETERRLAQSKAKLLRQNAYLGQLALRLIKYGWPRQYEELITRKNTNIDWGPDKRSLFLESIFTSQEQAGEHTSKPSKSIDDQSKHQPAVPQKPPPVLHMHSSKSDDILKTSSHKEFEGAQEMKLRRVSADPSHPTNKEPASLTSSSHSNVFVPEEPTGKDGFIGDDLPHHQDKTRHNSLELQSDVSGHRRKIWSGHTSELSMSNISLARSKENSTRSSPPTYRQHRSRMTNTVTSNRGFSNPRRPKTAASRTYPSGRAGRKLAASNNGVAQIETTDDSLPSNKKYSWKSLFTGHPQPNSSLDMPGLPNERAGGKGRNRHLVSGSQNKSEVGSKHQISKVLLPTSLVPIFEDNLSFLQQVFTFYCKNQDLTLGRETALTGIIRSPTFDEIARLTETVSHRSFIHFVKKFEVVPKLLHMSKVFDVLSTSPSELSFEDFLMRIALCAKESKEALYMLQQEADQMVYIKDLVNDMNPDAGGLVLRKDVIQTLQDLERNRRKLFDEYQMKGLKEHLKQCPGVVSDKASASPLWPLTKEARDQLNKVSDTINVTEIVEAFNKVRYSQSAKTKLSKRYSRRQTPPKLESNEPKATSEALRKFIKFLKNRQSFSNMNERGESDRINSDVIAQETTSIPIADNPVVSRS